MFGERDNQRYVIYYKQGFGIQGWQFCFMDEVGFMFQR